MKYVWIRFCFLVSTGLGSGFLIGALRSKISGKDKRGAGGGLMGSIFALSIQCAFYLPGTVSPWTPIWWTMVTFIIGLIVIPFGARHMYATYGPRVRHDKTETEFDYNEINWDEFNGSWANSIPVYLAVWFFDLSIGASLLLLGIAFAIFRRCDDKKWWPVKKLESLWPETAFGVMIDDTVGGLLSGIYAVIAALLFILLGWLR